MQTVVITTTTLSILPPRLSQAWKQPSTITANPPVEAERDRTDKRILARLDKNARISAAAIGRELGLSRTAVQDRIFRMETAGAIQGYRAVSSG